MASLKATTTMSLTREAADKMRHNEGRNGGPSSLHCHQGRAMAHHPRHVIVASSQGGRVRAHQRCCQGEGEGDGQITSSLERRQGRECVVVKERVRVRVRAHCRCHCRREGQGEGKGMSSSSPSSSCQSRIVRVRVVARACHRRREG